MSATLGGWALIAHGTSSAPADTVADTVAVAMPVSGAPQLAPLPTVIAPLAGLDQIAASQLAPLTDNSLVLQPAPLPSTPRVTMLWPRARSRSSN